MFYADSADFMYSIAASLRSRLLMYSDHQQYKLFCIECSINYAVHYEPNPASQGIVGTAFVDAEKVKPEIELLRPQFDFRTLALKALFAH